MVERFYTVVKLPHDPFTKVFLGRCQSHTLKVDGRFHKYYVAGSGPAVLLVHGLNTNLGSMVPLAEDLVAEGYRVALFDVPAYGESLGTRGDPVEIRGLLRALYAKLPALHAVVGHSMGGLWALSAWHPLVGARTLVSISSPPGKRFLVERFAEFEGLDEEAVAGVAAEIERRYGAEVWEEFSATAAAAAAGVPGLVVHGTADDYVPPEHAAELHASWPRSAVELVDGVGHFDIVESPEVRKLVCAHVRNTG
jgi:pimeloyl-ACP methyl ester carboxylesterase